MPPRKEVVTLIDLMNLLASNVCVSGLNAGAPCSTDAECLIGTCASLPSSVTLDEALDGISVSMKNIAQNLEEEIQFTPSKEPPCGNGIRGISEECDDGNNIDGDGCSSTCRVEFLKTEQKCREAVGPELMKFAVQMAKCMSKCRKLEANGKVPTGSCDAGSVTDDKTNECIAKATAKADAKILKKCPTPPEYLADDLPGLVSAVVSVINSMDPTLYSSISGCLGAHCQFSGEPCCPGSVCIGNFCELAPPPPR